MSDRTTSAGVGGLVLLAVCGLIAYRLHERSNARTPHAITVWDRSLSTKDGCASVAGIEHAVLVSKRMEKGSTVTLLATGDASSANEPVLVVRHEVPRMKRAMEGPDAGERRRESLLAETWERCRATAPTKASPIVVAVRRAADQLRSMGCGGETPVCSLAIVSDGEEEGDAVVAAALTRADKKIEAPLIDNEGITVTLCGLTDTVGASPPRGKTRRRPSAVTADRDVASVARLTSVWISLFTRPDLVTVAPLCPKAVPVLPGETAALH